MKKETAQNIAHLLTIVAFIIATFVPLTATILSATKKNSVAENRMLSTLPKVELTKASLKAFPKAFNQYYADHFGLRDLLITGYKKLKFNLEDSASEDVIIGKNDWLFLGPLKPSKKKPSDDPIGDFRNINNYSEAELQSAIEYFNILNLWLEKQDIKFLFMIAPNKHTIYEENLPTYITKTSNQSATDQLITKLRELTNITVIDVREALLAKKVTHQLYYKIDTHWNHYGANIAQYEIMKTLRKLFPEAPQARYFPFVEQHTTTGDLARFIGLDGFQDIEPKPIFEGACEPRKSPKDAGFFDPYSFNCEGKPLNGVIFRDSFFSALIPYLSRQLGRSTFIWKKPTFDDFKHYITIEKPDFIIEEWVERSLPLIPKMPKQLIEPLYARYFSCSQDIVLKNNFSTWALNEQLITQSSDETLKLQSTHHDPIIELPELSIKQNSQYLVHLEMNSSSNGLLQLFYSDNKTPQIPFSEARVLSRNVYKGDNNFYLLLNQPNLGKKLRLDPISTKADIEIKSLTIKSVDFFDEDCAKDIIFPLK